MKIQSRSVKMLLVAAVTVWATTGVTQAMGRHGAGHEGALGMHAPGGREGGGFMAERMLDRLNATAEQKAQIRRIMEGSRQDLQARHQASQQLRQRMMEALAQPNVDANAVEALRQQMTAQHEQGSQRMTQAMVEAARVLTPEQRKLAAEQFAKHRDMMQRHHREREAFDKPRS